MSQSHGAKETKLLNKPNEVTVEEYIRFFEMNDFWGNEEETIEFLSTLRYQLSIKKLEELFGFPSGKGTKPRFDREELNDCGLLLGTNLPLNSARSKSNQIRNPVIRYFQRSVANIFYPRESTGTMSKHGHEDDRFRASRDSPPYKGKECLERRSQQRTTSNASVDPPVWIQEVGVDKRQEEGERSICVGGVVTPILEICGVPLKEPGLGTENDGLGSLAPMILEGRNIDFKPALEDLYFEGMRHIPRARDSKSLSEAHRNNNKLQKWCKKQDKLLAKCLMAIKFLKDKISCSSSTTAIPQGQLPQDMPSRRYDAPEPSRHEPEPREREIPHVPVRYSSFKPHESGRKRRTTLTESSSRSRRLMQSHSLRDRGAGRNRRREVEYPQSGAGRHRADEVEYPPSGADTEHGGSSIAWEQSQAAIDDQLCSFFD
ncbi:hypothetical protein ISN45_At05g028100 [Arabidopsis thaliana x Arabidopsis arenosa]|uniref:Arabidopsis retrotransposon Orf1 C-terminal domain-containing protein n=1 Tax=Arabidopsis thaliana x Arabidopsis arenosa TaxID=1240361 RepID=A0A8T2D452_9BRAS|nr:hypothetical protein ISN45_At05g028100 [Arabidopsis thaliana x Arabidopsis arenosa]